MPPADAGDRAGDEGDVPELVARIRGEISRGGPITFARFMEIALYDPEFGYYRTRAERPGRGGDFLTAPETHPIFGQAIARQIEQLWDLLERPSPFALIEYGAGSGALAHSMLSELERPGGPMVGSVRYDAIEINRHRRAALAERLAAAGLARLGPRRVIDPAGAPAPIDRPTSAGDPTGTGEPAQTGDPPAEAGCVIANEFLDALPVHRVQWRDGQLQELLVEQAGDGFVDRPTAPSTPALAVHLAEEGVGLAEGQQAEVCLGIDGWFDELSRRLRSGYVIVIDYGRPATELYSESRFAGTVMGYFRHRAIEDPYRHVGRQDLTAHVDFTAVELAARRHGFEPLGLTTQAEFLIGAGGEELLERVRSNPGTELAAWVELRSALVRMLDPRAMGRFRVLILARNAPTDTVPRGLAYRMAAGTSAQV